MKKNYLPAIGMCFGISMPRGRNMGIAVLLGIFSSHIAITGKGMTLQTQSHQIAATQVSQKLNTQGFAKNSTSQKNQEPTGLITITLQQVSLKQALSEIEKKTSYTFIYNDQTLERTGLVSIQEQNQSLAKILTRILQNTNLTYRVVGQSIVISPQEHKTQNTEKESRVIRGQVTDEEGQPLPGASVVVKGTVSGTLTDVKGEYSITVPENALALLFSYIGYQSTEVAVGSQNTINVRLVANNNSLNEVVVTALGIKREEKALGYATQTLNSEAINDARSNNFVNALSGKVAGLTLVSPGSGPVNSVRVKLRGDNSMDPSKNNALIVLDGVPMSSGMTTSGVTDAYGAGSGNDVPIDFGNGIADINPDDIESITVLKGASATALYGSRAANGALIITTKSGSRKEKGVGITVNSNLSFNSVLKWPEYQYEYGQGTGKTMSPASDLYYSYGASADGASTSGTSSAFGPAFNGQSYFQYDPTLEGQSAERQPWRPYKNNIKDFWKTGYTLTNNVALEGANDKGSVRASVTHSKNEWIMPNTGFERITAALSVNYKISERLKISSKVNYTHKSSDNLPATGYNNQAIAYFMIFQNPNVDLNWYKPRWKTGKEQVDQIHPFSSYIDNPYLIAYEMTNSLNNNTVVGNMSATYTLSDKLELLVRSAIDLSDEDREQRRPYSTANFQRGYFKQQTILSSEVNTDALITYKEKLGNRIALTASIGGNIRNQRYRNVNGSVDGLVIPGVYKLSNGVNQPLMTTNNSVRRVNSLYGLASFSYDEKIFVDVTGRNDWSSTLPSQNNSFFYPSISTSFILSDLLHLPAAVSFAKLRLSAAQVGNDTDPYKTRKYYGQSDFPGSGSLSTTLFNVDFKPEITTSYEVGLEYFMFNRRLGLDFTLYQNSTRNQILDVPLDPTTGYTKAVLNAGKVRNQGVELVLSGRPLDHTQLKWDITLTWAINRNKVLELAEGMTDQQVIGTGGNATIIARKGGTTGDIYGFGFMRSPDGQIIYTKDGLPARPVEIQYIGNAYADWKGGIQNTLTFKNFRFSVLVDGQYGGIVYSQTHHKMTEQGKLKHTLRGREEGYIIGEGVVDNGDGTYTANTKKVTVGDYYADYYRRANVESNSFDASYIKLREARLEYSLPKVLLQRSRIFEQASIAFYGRDLLMITNFPMFDPETAALNGATILPGIEMGQMPSTRTYGMNLTLKF
ncbi:SusC/RagA family TonB-linked outer membrane protein [Xanthocytophaga agilis]|uniref:SusC/RagA family TonB-linked outer membrane protein n=1 Tax=Xanthocytophaga agilis TaxID=3048010 RepID=A0AAE3QW35_9BACT|nr:SusC/RagA family TonB-linked outer membrane protein [Xanthocytophaga agilis]MDJ1499094.1 SusC/RagA family TonB-linked outer membrane protein [Xanthocytophaga agilis]